MYRFGENQGCGGTKPWCCIRSFELGIKIVLSHANKHYVGQSAIAQFGNVAP